ncbi:cytochrome P450 [Thelonectria olida]|uniref:Cytochrome P450 n=1 Tax=Thelonectria olida TaxID=1576542 RepID=A0A9P8W170_9HYPO|nr:cytochrome P450 [Thelonectria olida]
MEPPSIAPSWTSFALFGAIAVTSWLLIHILQPKTSDGGRKTLLKLPIIADLHDSPIEKPLLRWDAWAKHQGAIATPKLFGLVPIVVLNTSEAATELLSRRSAWYSNRPGSPSMEMITGSEPGKSKFTLLHDFDEHLKLHHRILSPSLGPLAAPRYQPVMELESTHLAKDLIDLAAQNKGIVSSDCILPFLERTQASIILALHYGIQVPTLNDDLYHQILNVQIKVGHMAANPWLPDFIPVLRHLPSFLSPWKQAADKLYNQQTALFLRLLKMGDESPDWNATKEARAAAAKYAKEPISDIDLAYTIATSVQGGMDTSPRAFLWLFVAAISVNKDFMARAHAVLDAVVGRDRLPRFSDRASMPYLDAIVSELMRWRPIAPGSIPRRADKADDYKGTLIVKNATVFANAWSIGRDPEAFDPELGNLDDFIPERWLHDCNMEANILSQGELKTALPLPVFGQGRRSCLGKRVALDGSFMQIVTMIWAFDFELVEEIDPMNMLVVNFMTLPKPFSFRLKPRGPWIEEVIERKYLVD